MQAIETQYKGYRFRSRLEARWAVFLTALDVEWIYEPQGFVLSDGTCYLPDFYLPQNDLWIEVKPSYKSNNPCKKNKHGEFSAECGSPLLVTSGLPKVNDVGPANELHPPEILNLPYLYMGSYVDMNTGDIRNPNYDWLLIETMFTPEDHIRIWYGAIHEQLKDICFPLSAKSVTEEAWRVTDYLEDHPDPELKPLAYIGTRVIPLFVIEEVLYFQRRSLEGGDYATIPLREATNAARSARFEHGETPNV